MCANYIPSTHNQLQQYFGVAAPDSEYKAEAFPGYMAPMIRTPGPDAVLGDRACALGMFGLVPGWAEPKLARNTYNARTETVASKPSFRTAYKRGQFCVLPVSSFFEPAYERGKVVRYEIADAEGAPLAIAGIWEQKADNGNGLPLLSFSMLTINADGDPLMQRFHKPEDEKRMLVILPAEHIDDWLHCSAEDAPDFFVRYPAERLVARPAPRSGPKAAQASLLDL